MSRQWQQQRNFIWRGLRKSKRISIFPIDWNLGEKVGKKRETTKTRTRTKKRLLRISGQGESGWVIGEFVRDAEDESKVKVSVRLAEPLTRVKTSDRSILSNNPVACVAVSVRCAVLRKAEKPCHMEGIALTFWRALSFSSSLALAANSCSWAWSRSFSSCCIFFWRARTSSSD